MITSGKLKYLTKFTVNDISRSQANWLNYIIQHCVEERFSYLRWSGLELRRAQKSANLSSSNPLVRGYSLTGQVPLYNMPTSGCQSLTHRLTTSILFFHWLSHAQGKWPRSLIYMSITVSCKLYIVFFSNNRYCRTLEIKFRVTSYAKLVATGMI